MIAGDHKSRPCCDYFSPVMALEKNAETSAVSLMSDGLWMYIMILSSGAVPMDLAEKKVDWFIAEEKARAVSR